MGAKSSKTKPNDGNENNNEVMVLDAADIRRDSSLRHFLQKASPPKSPQTQSPSSIQPPLVTASTSDLAPIHHNELKTASAPPSGTNTNTNQKVIEILETRAPVKRPQLESLGAPPAMKRTVDLTLDLSSSEEDEEDNGKSKKKNKKKQTVKQQKKKPDDQTNEAKKTPTASISIQDLKRSTPMPSKTTERYQSEADIRVVKGDTGDDDEDYVNDLHMQKKKVQSGSALGSNTKSPVRVTANALDSFRRPSEVIIRTTTVFKEPFSFQEFAHWQEDDASSSGQKQQEHPTKPPSSRNQHQTIGDLDDLERETSDALNAFSSASSSSGHSQHLRSSTTGGRKANEKRTASETASSSTPAAAMASTVSSPAAPSTLKTSRTNRKLDDTDETIMNDILSEIID